MCLVLASADASAQESRSDLFSQQPGRYQIVMNPQIRADTFLLDTATGKIWQLAKLTMGNPFPPEALSRAYFFSL
jgi:hypothetical protein